jgi:hypothetical protein
MKTNCKNIVKSKIVVISKYVMLLFTSAILLSSCSKDDETTSNTALAANTLTFKGNPITFNGVSIDDDNLIQEYIFTTASNLSMVLYCRFIPNTIQNGNSYLSTYTADAVLYLPVNNYPTLTVRGYINYQGKHYRTNSGQVKIKRNDTGNQTFEFVNLKLKDEAGTDEQTLNGTINLPKN